ncbi:hypothetical protein RHSIM_Rhsim07G0253400 [Rhododendron simsii]|uniref:Uncharacterized protein n=1 Tax=Rhododendron simsii TaxID=118357 RepID=A0A834GNS4_RHOSS|nr:hypothetical protein RHSIM_Rhsim07G0253400 [Rhododendron simsii]
MLVQSGIRALILKTYDTHDDDHIILFAQNSNDDVAHMKDRWFDRQTEALGILKEIEEFLSSNPFEILTLILEDCVMASNGLTKVFEAARLTKYLLPLKKMPRHGGDWPLVKDMVAANQRLIVFTSNQSKEESEGIAYKWNFIVECKYGIQQRRRPPCIKGEYLPTTDVASKSLVLLNYYSSPRFNKVDLMKAIDTCYVAASHRWPNFIAVDNDEFFKVHQRQGYRLIAAVRGCQVWKLVAAIIGCSTVALLS